MIKQIGLPLRGRPILLITRMITDRIGLHSVLLPLLNDILTDMFPQICNFCVSINEHLLYAIVFTFFKIFCTVILGRFLTFWENFENQDDGRFDSGASAGAEGARGRSSIPIENGKSIKPRKFGGRPRTYVRTD